MERLWAPHKGSLSFEMYEIIQFISSFNLSLHVVSRKFSIFFSSRLVWAGNQQKIEIPCMMECLSKRIFTRLPLLSGARRLFNLFLQAKQFSTNQQNLKHRMDLHVSPKEDYKYNYFTPYSFNLWPITWKLFRLVLQQHSLNERNIFYYFMCTGNLLKQDLWRNVLRPGFERWFSAPGKIYSPAVEIEFKVWEIEV